MNPINITILATILGIVINGILIQKLQTFRQTDTYRNNQGRFIRLLKYEERFVVKFQDSIRKLVQAGKYPSIKSTDIFELILIGGWAFWIPAVENSAQRSIHITFGHDFKNAGGVRCGMVQDPEDIQHSLIYMAVCSIRLSSSAH